MKTVLDVMDANVEDIAAAFDQNIKDSTVFNGDSPEADADRMTKTMFVGLVLDGLKNLSRIADALEKIEKDESLRNALLTKSMEDFDKDG